MPGDADSFVAMIRTLKHEKGMSNKKLAKIFGLHESTVSFWLRNGMIDPIKLEKYWKALQDYIDENIPKEDSARITVDSTLNVTALKITPISTTGALDKLVKEEERLLLEIDRLTTRIEKVKSAKEILRELAAN
jgi:transcriptional regulator with XRE-family HTH domain